MSKDKPINILVVDDLEDKLLAYRAVLDELGQNVVTARSGEEALKLILEDEYAIILLDVNMPGMDGFETAALIRKRKKSAKTPIIFLTAFADEIRTAHGYALGAVDYIPTPVVPEILCAKVRVFLELFRLREEAARQAEERARREAAEKAVQHSNFLARASAALAYAIESDEFIRTLATLPIPQLAGASAVAITDESRQIVRTEVAWIDHKGEIQNQTIDDSWRIDGRLAETIERVLLTGKAQPVRCDRLNIAPGRTDQSPSNPPPLLPNESLGFTLALPLSARGQMHAVLCLSLGYANRTYNPDLVSLADDLASRAGTAMENAVLLRNIREADRRKDEFLAMLAHELRNPLAPIRNAVHIAQSSGPHSPNVQFALDMIDRQAKHMTRLIDDLLNVMRIASGKIRLQKDRIDLCQIVRHTAEDHRSMLESSELRLTVSVPEEAIWVDGDPTRLAQVIGNLLHNANKFTPAGGAVGVSVSVDSDRRNLSVQVQDTGIGIEPAVLPRVFDVFVQADQGLDRGRGGLGLGLALVKGLVELHDGTVSASSAGLGHGSEFTIRLPASTPPRASASPGAHTMETAIRRRILIIEDNRDSAESTRLLLVQMGHDARSASTGPEGISVAREFAPHVILCDIGLPGGLSGYDVVRTLRREPLLDATYVIALTGYGRDADVAQAKAAGFDSHMTKPVGHVQLQEAIARVSELSDAASSNAQR